MTEAGSRCGCVIGIDIGEGAWACAILDLDEAGHILAVKGFRWPYEPVPTLPEDCLVAIVDVPIGLLEDRLALPSKKGKTGSRDVDRGARKWCRWSASVAPPPTRGQFQSGLREHDRATKEGRRRNLANVSPDGLTMQSLELIPAIRSGELLKVAHPCKVYESHPEVVFGVLAGGKLPFSKNSLSGALVRAALLGKHLGRDCARWAVEQEVKLGINAENWLDALAMTAVAYDWLAVDKRTILFGSDGTPKKWEKESDFIMALPRAMAKRPQHLQPDAQIKIALDQLSTNC